jgi:nucleotide-binding universal stress UspA family protein
MERILVGMDGSAPARDALRWAANLATITGAEVIAVNALLPVQSEKRPGYLERLRRQRADDLEQWCGDVLDQVGSTLVVDDGDPRDVLPAAMKRHGADLLVVASSGEHSRGPGFLHVGSVVEFLAHHLHHPLAVIAPKAAPDIAHAVIGVDGSEHGREAIRWIAEVAGATGARVTAVAVAEPGHPIASSAEDADWQLASERILAHDWAAPLAELGDRFTAVVSRAAPVADVIVDEAETSGADLVVVGARGLGGVTGLRIGGTALAVLHRADRSVVLVPSPADQSRR